jgi:hypothetical protein
MMFKSIIATLAFAFAAQAQATIGIKLGQPGYGGNGCPQGSASAVLSPDETELSILFDSYQVEAGREVGKRMDRKSCNLAVPILVPHGYSITLIKVDYRGYVSAPSGGFARLESEYFFAGQRGPRFSRTFNGTYENDYTVTDNLVATALVYSACGARDNLRINSSLMTQTNRRGDQAYATLDSVDLSNAMVYRIAWRRCN